ncbi:uncharacterized protein DNG_09624 [Cephalotrichum gorgonifer]|uniref:Uncharacterized protein n=1 Tax=Cephalotrichum gorgonifer TaxID=2041049 RepID=A0AAE8SZI2_9PEZI|nr:uncharacterized protein DNG_09624 [Cephalotrichum gorgonifer]
MQTTVATLLFLSGCLIATGAAKSCSTSEISSMDLSSCTCAGQLSGCIKYSTCPACKTGSSAIKDIRDCTQGCTDTEWDCQACGLWFHTLCDCIYHPNTCTNSGTITPHGAAVWVLLEKDHLVTTTEKLPGILEMKDTHDEGWIFAQEHRPNPGSDAVWINSVYARQMEQVHIHSCPRNSQTAAMLAKETIKSDKHLVQLQQDKELYCLGSVRI